MGSKESQARRSVRARAGLVTFVAGVAVVTVASAAFACTQLVGTSAIQGINGTSGSATYVADGKDELASSRGFCGGAPTERVQLTHDSQPPLPTVAQVKITVGPAPACATTTNSVATKAPLGLWDVRWVKAEEAIDWDYPYPRCHGSYEYSLENPEGGQWVPLGAMAVDANGNGNGEYALGDAMVGPGNICLWQAGDNNTVPTSINVAPPTIFMKLNLI